MASSTNDKPNKINAKGLINSTLKKGFSTRDSLSEIVDNSCDANATKCHITHILNNTSPLTNTVSPFVVIVDDGNGMTQEQANNCLTIHNEKSASDDKNGFAGIGLSHALANITCLKGKSIILTKSSTGDILETCVNWDDVCDKGVWHPEARDVSAKNLPLWDRYAIDKSHGTIIITSVDSHVSSGLVEKAGDIEENFSYTYADFTNLSIRLNLTGDTDVEVGHVDVIGFNDVPEDARRTTHLEVYKNDGETRVYYGNQQHEMVRIDFANPKGAKLKDYPPPSEFKKVCGLTLVSSYVPDTGSDSREQGAMYFQRGRKMIAKISNPPIDAGDFDKRKILNYANHKVKYDYRGDEIFKTQMNKSQLSMDNINHVVLKTIEYVAKLWCDTYHKAHRIPKSRDPQNPHELMLKDIAKMIKENNAEVLMWLEQGYTKFKTPPSAQDADTQIC